MEIQSRSEKMSKFATGRSVLILALLYIPVQLSMIFIIFPIVSGYTPEKPLDMRFNYSVNEIYQLFSSLTEHGRNLGTVVYLYDNLFAIIYSLFFTFLIIFLLKKASMENSFIFKFRYIPLLAGCFDILENISIIIMLHYYPRELTFIAGCANIFTISKWIFLIAAYILPIFGCILVIKNKMCSFNKSTIL